MIISKISRYCLFVGVLSLFSLPLAAQEQGQSCPEKGRMHGAMGFQGMGGGPAGNHSALMLDISELEKLMAEININKSVTPKITTIARSFITFFNEHIIKVQREELNIKEELLKEKPDLQAVQGFITKKTQQFAEIEFAQIKRDVEIKSLLTPDEYDKWKSAMTKKMRPMMAHCNQNQPTKKDAAK